MKPVPMFGGGLRAEALASVIWMGGAIEKSQILGERFWAEGCAAPRRRFLFLVPRTHGAMLIWMNTSCRGWRYVRSDRGEQNTENQWIQRLGALMRQRW